MAAQHFSPTTQFQSLLATAFHKFGQNVQQFVKTDDRFGEDFLLFYHLHKESPKL